MTNQDAKPGFGKKLKTDMYYAEVTALVRSLQPTRTLRQIAFYLNSANYRSPRGLPWDRQRVSNFMRSRSI